MESVLKKVSSRKFLVAVSGVVSGIVLIVGGNTTEGVTAIVTSVVAYLAAEGGVLAILRQSGAERTLTALNAGDTPAELALPWADTVARSTLDGQEFFVPDGVLRLTLPPVSGMILI